MKIPLFKKNLVVMKISLFTKKAVYENTFIRDFPEPEPKKCNCFGSGSGSGQKGRLRAAPAPALQHCLKAHQFSLIFPN